MLAWGSSPKGKGSEDRWPSWVPDIQSRTVIGIDYQQFAAGYSRCSAESCENAGIKGKRSFSILRARGVQCGTVIRAETIFTARLVGLQPVAEALRALVFRKHESRDDYVAGESLAHAAAKVLCLSSYKERYPEYDTPELETWMQSLFPSRWRTGEVESNSDKFVLEDYPQWKALERSLATKLASTCLLETGEGYAGFGPVGTQAGDIVSVLLGCNSPMLIRPNPDGETYTVIGPVYMHGLHDANALLGPLPEPWQVQIFQDRAGIANMFRFFQSRD